MNGLYEKTLTVTTRELGRKTLIMTRLKLSKRSITTISSNSKLHTHVPLVSL
jgi:hypothetical protein